MFLKKCFKSAKKNGSLNMFKKLSAYSAEMVIKGINRLLISLLSAYSDFRLGFQNHACKLPI